MKFVTFSRAGNRAARLGLLREDGVLDLASGAERASVRMPFDAADMISLIVSAEAGLAAVREIAARNDDADFALDQIQIFAPIPRPRKNVFCVGWNYLEHFEEGERFRQTAQELPQHPVFFSKAVTAVTGPFDPVPFDPGVSKKIDWEVELGVVIGKSGKNISEADAFKHVFGYTVVNDVSARDLQKRHGGQWLKGKSLDGSCPMGPCLVTADEIDPANMRVTTRVNGETKQDSNTRYMYFKIPRLIAELSLGMTLEAGDIISTGTPQGVGFARTPPEWLKPGDVLETEIAGIGMMRNRIGG
ncbi:MAG: fumarylacetoacetate hydrolase family protein [Burkholderiales bacterium]